MPPTAPSHPLASETICTIKDAANHRLFRVGGKPHISTIQRYIATGLMAKNGNRVRLESIRLPRLGICTSDEAIARFVDRLNDQCQEHRQAAHVLPPGASAAFLDAIGI